jgi:hypothetical protein
LGRRLRSIHREPAPLTRRSFSSRGSDDPLSASGDAVARTHRFSQLSDRCRRNLACCRARCFSIRLNTLLRRWLTAAGTMNRSVPIRPQANRRQPKCAMVQERLRSFAPSHCYRSPPTQSTCIRKRGSNVSSGTRPRQDFFGAVLWSLFAAGAVAIENCVVF